MTNQSQLSTFNFESNFIRVLSVNDEPWFVAKDPCDTLDISNPSKAILNLDDDEKMISSDSNLKLGSAGNGAQSLSLVSESGMYTLILRCRDAVKKGSIPHRFRKWVTAEVLPQIRKTGKYEHKTTVDDRTGLRNAVNMLVSKKGLIYSEAYNLVHQYMNVESIEDIPADKLQSAVEYVHKIALEGEWITEEPKSHRVEIPQAGRWLVIVDKYDPRRNRIKDMSGCNFVDTKLARQLLGETHQMADLLLELSKRMRLIDGYYEDNFNTPLMETKVRTII